MNLRNWRIAWGDLVKRLVALIISYSSVAWLLVAFLPEPSKLPWWALSLLAFIAFSFLYQFGLEIFKRRSVRVFATSDVNGIRRYMHRWIQHGGIAAVWTRDMTWAQNAETKKLLKEKAKRKELILCLPEENAFATELAKAGASVCAYGTDLLNSPASRFTITHFGKSGARVAVGRPDGDVHVIEEFSEGGHPAFALAQDLVGFALAIRKERGSK